MSLQDRTVPTQAEFDAYRERFSNWGRWGADDELGTLNLITPEVRRNAATLVRDGRTVSLSLTVGQGRAALPSGFEQQMHINPVGSADTIRITFHGWTVTHLDSLCHIFTGEGGQLYNGRPASDVTEDGALSHSVEPFSGGIVTRGVLYDVARHRGVDHVPLDAPVHGWELLDIAQAQGVEPRPGDAVVIRSGGPAFYAAHPEFATRQFGQMPGVHASALEFLYEYDASLLVWDLLDAGNQGYRSRRFKPDDASSYSVPLHEIAIPYMGMPLLDNADLDELSETCAELGRSEFMLMVAPLRVRGGTGSPVNPIAVL
jgi:kynurenine formamidase